MNNSDLLFLISIRLDNETIRSLSKTEVWKIISSFAGGQYFWYKRTEYLVESILKREVQLQQRIDSDWKNAYYILDLALGMERPFTCLSLDLTSASVLLELGYDCTLNNSNALTVACCTGDSEVVRFLLRNGADPSTNFCLVSAVYYHKYESAFILLDDGRVCANEADEDGSTSLHHAAVRGEVELVERLLAYPGIDPNIEDDDENRSPIETAIRWMHEGDEKHVSRIEQVVYVLLQSPLLEDVNIHRLLCMSNPNENIARHILTNWRFKEVDQTRLLEFLWNGCNHILPILLESCICDPTYRNSKYLKEACERGDAGIVSLFLKDGRADPTVDNHYCITEASARGHWEVVELLLMDGRADPTADNHFCIEEASSRGHCQVVDVLLMDKRVDPRMNNNAACRCAQESGHIDVVRMIERWRPRR